MVCCSVIIDKESSCGLARLGYAEEKLGTGQSVLL